MDFQSSKLGTKEYWDNLYSREMNNFRQHKDCGEVWFGLRSVEAIVDWCRSRKDFDERTSVLDIGCGNAYTLVELAKTGFHNLYDVPHPGTDYSPEAVRLAEAYVLHENLQSHITIMLDNILETTIKRQFDLVLDKGTFDAIALSDDKTARGKYIKSVRDLVEDSGFLLITSCNFTERELLDTFSGNFEYVENIEYGTFSYGGARGSTISSVILKPKLPEN